MLCSSGLIFLNDRVAWWRSYWQFLRLAQSTAFFGSLACRKAPLQTLVVRNTSQEVESNETAAFYLWRRSLSILQVWIVLCWTDKPKLRRPSGCGSHTTAKKGSACLPRTAFLKGKSTDAEIADIHQGFFLSCFNAQVFIDCGNPRIKDSSTTLTVADRNQDRDHRVEPDRAQSKNVRALPELNIAKTLCQGRRVYQSQRIRMMEAAQSPSHLLTFSNIF
jgi:hypothetical protein